MQDITSFIRKYRNNPFEAVHYKDTERMSASVDLTVEFIHKAGEPRCTCSVYSSDSKDPSKILARKDITYPIGMCDDACSWVKYNVDKFMTAPDET